MMEDIENTTNTEVNNTKKPKVDTITSTLVSLHWGTASDQTPILCPIVSQGNLHTKPTDRSYLVALKGAAGAVAYAKQKLDKGEVEVLAGAEVTWERTTYPAGLPHKRGNDTVIEDKEDIVDHITEVNIQPIAGVLLQQYLEEKSEPMTPLQEKLILLNFGVKL